MANGPGLQLAPSSDLAGHPGAPEAPSILTGGLAVPAAIG